jgi:hypothetical protein
MEDPNPPRTPDSLSPNLRVSSRWPIRTALAFAAALALSLGGAIALSPPFHRGATRLFGRVVDGVKDHPRATIVLCLGGAATLWLAIGTLAAGQEWRARRLRN